jgi:tRNA threonylcarbamoyladenosine biosynthesis protein TsaB
MLILAIDTSSRTGSVALLRDKRVMAEFSFRTDANQAATILLSIQRVLDWCESKVKDIGLIALTTGPGSFTGLRIGASTVKGLALPYNTPVAGISTLEALAYNAMPSRVDVCPLLDAKKNEVYTALYRTGENGLPEPKELERVTEPRGFISQLSEDVLFLGDGFQKYAELIEESCPVKAYSAPEHLQFIRASAIGILGIEKFSRGQTVNLLTFIPRYLRFSHAEVNLTA